MGKGRLRFWTTWRRKILIAVLRSRPSSRKVSWAAALTVLLTRTVRVVSGVEVFLGIM